jgi:FkbM family methyltransferase
LKKSRLIKLAACLVVGICIPIYLPEGILLSSFLVGRSKCPLSQTIAVAKSRSDISAITGRIEAESRLLQTDGNFELWSTPHGNLWLLKGTARDVFEVLAEQELKFYGNGPQGIQPGDVVIDCGANIGGFTRTALDMGASLVIAVEPAPEDVICLERNFHSEIERGTVKICPKGVWDKEGVLEFHSAGLAAGFIGPSSSTDRALQVTTIDNLVNELQLNRVNFIKMDIEGSEPEALNGALRTLKTFKPRLAVSVEHSLNESDQVREVVRNMVPTYTSECGPCSYLGSYITPNVIYFR